MGCWKQFIQAQTVCFMYKYLDLQGPGKSTYRTAFGTSVISKWHKHTKTAIQAQQRPVWLPGLDSPAHLDGTLAGDFGFDPLGLGEDSASLKWYMQAELVHACFAMAGVAGILFTDVGSYFYHPESFM
ncbi:hypothetical protein R6Q59_010294 [Mikania micrantha]